MRHKTKRILTLLMIAALVLSLPVFSASAAGEEPTEEGGGAVSASSSSTPPLTGLTLTAYRKGENTEMPDIVNANIAIDLYLIAAAEEDPDHGATFKFKAPNEKSGITVDQLKYESLPKATDSESAAAAFWEGIRSAAAKAILPEGSSPAYAATKSGTADTPITDLAGGLYLIVARDGSTGAKYADYRDVDDNKEVITKAFSDEHIYSYLPQLVVLPGTEKGSTAGAKWVNPYKVYMKPQESVRLGNLWITKHLPVIDEGGEAIFVFHVKATKGTFTYEVDVSLSFTAAGDSTYKLLHLIPVGAAVEVTEEYDGTRFTPDGVTKQGTIPAPTKDDDGVEDACKLEFTNTFNGNVITGYGIENRFVSNGKDNWDFYESPAPVIYGQPEEGAAS